MSKDPAFLFYSKDFYEGTRTMLPEERACYIDLLIYQHQNGGIIPNDLRRVLMYCNGCNEATLIATLEAKFTKNERGWHNEKLSEVMESRSKFSQKQSMNGKVGQFFKKVKKILAPEIYKKFEQAFENESIEEIFNQIKGLEIIEANIIAMLEAKLKHLAIANEIKDSNLIDFEKGGVGEKTFKENSGTPTFDQVKDYFETYNLPESEARKFFDHYDSLGWIVNGSLIRKFQPRARKWILDDYGMAGKSKSNFQNGTSPKPNKVEQANEEIFKGVKAALDRRNEMQGIKPNSEPAQLTAAQ